MRKYHKIVFNLKLLLMMKAQDISMSKLTFHHYQRRKYLSLLMLIFQANDNEVAVNFISINGQIDQDSSNDYAVSILDVQSTYDYVTLIINGDSYPYEISWAIIDFNDNTIASGELGMELMILKRKFV